MMVIGALLCYCVMACCCRRRRKSKRAMTYADSLNEENEGLSKFASLELAPSDASSILTSTDKQS